MKLKLLPILALIVGVIGLFSIRIFQESIFYDPLQFYYESAMADSRLPVVVLSNLLVNNAIRYILTSLLSLMIIWSIFRDMGVVKISFWIMLVVFVVLAPLYYYSITHDLAFGKIFTYYTRRILMQPMLLFLLVPSIYYMRHINKGE